MNGQWLSADVQAYIEPPESPLIKVEPEEIRKKHYQVRILEKPLTTASETCKINKSTFDYGQPEELLVLLRNFQIEIDGTGTTTASGRINYLHTMIRGTSLRELDKLALVGNSITNHLPHEGFT